MAKPFLTYDGQIEKLEKEKNLVISDREYAEFMLKQIGYFGLISGYKELFKNKTTNKYKDGTTFEDIVALYKFDDDKSSLQHLQVHNFETERGVYGIAMPI